MGKQSSEGRGRWKVAPGAGRAGSGFLLSFTFGDCDKRMKKTTTKTLECSSHSDGGYVMMWT